MPTRPNPLVRMRNPLLFVILVVILGTIAYSVVERWNPGDAFYMTVLTISTVGFQEVHHLDSGGRTVTVLLIVFGVGGLFYAATSFAEVIIEGHVREYARDQRMARQIAALRDHLIVVGFGRTGRQVALELVAEGAHFVVVENNPDVMEGLRTSGHRFVEGDGAADEVLKAAGIARARALICAGDSDQRNVYIVLTARSMRPDLYIVARAAFADSVPKLERAGADRVVSPYLMAGHRMVEMALRPVVVDVLDNVLRPSETEMGLEELLVRPGSRASGRSLSESGILDQGAMVLALRRAAGDLQVNPPADTAVEEGDLLVAMGTRRQLNSLAGLL